MKTIIFNSKRFVLYLAGLTTLLSACVYDEPLPYIERSGSGDVTFTLNLPVSPVIQTRAATEVGSKEENAIVDLQLLVCEAIENPGDKGKLLYVSPCFISNREGANKNKITFTTKLVFKEKCDLILIANAKAKVDSIAEEATRDEIKEFLTYKNKSGAWVIDGSAEAKAIPMYAELKGQNLSNQAYTPTEAFELQRMLARINVALEDKVKNFKLKKVHYYHYSQTGTVVPANDIPDDTEQSAGCLSYDCINDTCYNEIYVFEAKHKAPYGTHGWIDNPCLVVEGEYGTDGKNTFYRLDFISGTNNWLSVVRNHSYNFTITEVKGSGYTEQGQAAKSAPLNMEADVADWNNDNLKEISVDGPYILAVNKNEFDLPPLGIDTNSEINKLIIATNYDKGESNKNWTAVLSKSKTTIEPLDSNNEWVSLTHEYGTGTSTAEGDLVYIRCKPNDTGSSRAAYVHITAGRQTIVVELKQDIIPTYSVDFVDPVTGASITDPLVFGEWLNVITAHPTQSFKLEWSPKNEKVEIEVVLSTNYNSYKWKFAGIDKIESGEIFNNSGEMVYSVRPESFIQNEFDLPDLKKEVTITAKVGDKTATLKLEQKKIEYTFTIDPPFPKEFEYTRNTDSEMNKGQAFFFGVKANFNWRVKSMKETNLEGTHAARIMAYNDIQTLKAGIIGQANEREQLCFYVFSRNEKPSSGKVTLEFEDIANPERIIKTSFTVKIPVKTTAPKGNVLAESYIDNGKILGGILAVNKDKELNLDGNIRGNYIVYFKTGSTVALTSNHRNQFDPNVDIAFVPEGYEVDIQTYEDILIGNNEDVDDKDKKKGLGDPCQLVKDKDGVKGKFRATRTQDELCFNYANATTVTMHNNQAGVWDGNGELFFPLGAGYRYEPQYGLGLSTGQYMDGSFYRVSCISEDCLGFPNNEETPATGRFRAMPIRCIRYKD